jgi:APA family basic amino acid/polyamine antiporter
MALSSCVPLINWAYLHLLGHAAVASAEPGLMRPRPCGQRRPAGDRSGVAIVSASQVQLLSGPRLVFGMACDGRFFAPFRWVHPRFKTPAAAILLLGGTALVLLLVAGQGAVDKILNGAVFIDTVFFILTGLAVFVLRRKRADIPRPVRVPGYPFVPAMFVLGETAVLIGAFCDASLRHAAIIGAIWIAAAGLCYAAFFRQRDTIATVPHP